MSWQFPDSSRHSSAALGMLNVTHVMPILVLNTCTDANMQITINSFRQLFPDKTFSLTFLWLLAKSLTFPRQVSNSLTFPRFSRQASLVPTIALRRQHLRCDEGCARLTTAMVWFIFEHIFHFKPEHLPMGHPGDDLNAATESAVTTSTPSLKKCANFGKL